MFKACSFVLVGEKIMQTCQSEFGVKLPTTLLACRKEKFLFKINQRDNNMLRLFRSVT